MKIFYYDIREPMPPELLARIAPERRARAEAYRSAPDRARCLAAGALLSRALGIERDGMIALGQHGKPFLAGGGRQFSLSHAGNYAVLAAADSPVGADIERARPRHAALARRCCTPEEIAWLASQGGENAFLKLWTAKEAVLKATGEGLSRDMRSLCVLPAEDGPHRTAAGEWHLRWAELDGHTLCVACAEQISTITWERVLR